MVQRSKKKRIEAQKWAVKQYKKHRRHNVLHALPGVHTCIIILDNLKPSYNIGKIFRSADAFGVYEIHLIGTDYFPTQSAKGSFKWVPAFFHHHFEECYSSIKQRDYSFYILDPTAPSTIDQMVLDTRCAFIFGNEEHGFSFDRRGYPQLRAISVPQFGKVESLNVSIAASIVMYEFVRQQSP